MYLSVHIRIIFKVKRRAEAERKTPSVCVRGTSWQVTRACDWLGLDENEDDLLKRMIETPCRQSKCIAESPLSKINYTCLELLIL